MSQKTYFGLAVAIFSFVALIHGLCVVLGWRVTIADLQLSVVVNVVAFCLASYMAYHAWKLFKQAR